MLALIEHRRQAADAQSGDAFLQAVNGLLVLVGGHHGSAEGRQVVTKFGRLVHPQEGDGGRGVELELAYRELLFHVLEHRQHGSGQHDKYQSSRQPQHGQHNGDHQGQWAKQFK